MLIVCENLVGFLQSRIVGVGNTLGQFYVNLAECEPIGFFEPNSISHLSGFLQQQLFQDRKI